MKRVLYITYVDYFENAFPGVQAKIDGQMDTMRSNGLKVDRINQYGKQAQFFIEDEGTLLYSGFNRRFAITDAVNDALKKYSYAVAYIRFQFFSEDARRIVTKLHKKGVKVLMEFPTYPYEGELHQQGRKGELKLLCDRVFRILCAKYIDFFVTQAEEKEIYGVPCIQVLNGLDYSCHPLRKVKKPQETELHLLAVASMLPWHGYDRILYGLIEYNKNNYNRINVILHLVGEGKEIYRYKNIVKNGNIENNVVFHGMMSGQKLDNIASICDIAVGSLAAFRIGLKKMSTLKSREYCAWGFPTINATPTDILDMDDPFCLFVSEDESIVNISSVVEFYYDVYFRSNLSAQEIAEKIRKKAQSCSDIHNVFKPVLKEINNIRTI